MVTIFIRHRVADYDKWKEGYDNAEHLRKADGIVFASVHRDPEDANRVMAVHRFHNLGDAKNFIAAVPPVMAAAGVLGTPEIWIGDDVEQANYS